MKVVKVIAKRSDGEQFSYQNSDWHILKMEGIDFAPIEIFQQNRGFGHGDIITGKRKCARPIDIEVKSMNPVNNEIDRLRALTFHNSNYTYDLEFTYMGQTKIAKNCELTGAKCPSENVYKYQMLTLSFLSPEADLFANSQTDTNFVKTTPLWHVTRYYAPNGGKLYYGLIERTIVKPINYLGSEPAPIYATMVAKGAVNGVVVRVNDTRLVIDVDLKGGDTLIVDVANKTITLNGSRVNEGLYDFLLLPNLTIVYGDNEVQISAVDEDNLAFEADISYTGRYGGI